MVVSGRKSKLYILFIFVVILGSLVGKGLWVPWVSPNQAAKYLVLDDGKSPLNDSRGAAIHWGEQMYMPLSEETAKFNNISWIASNTLLDILSSNTNHPAWLLEQFQESNNVNIVILYCFISQNNGTVGTTSRCEPVFSQKPGDFSDGQKFLIEKARKFNQS